MHNLSWQNKRRKQITVYIYARMAITLRKFKAIFHKNKVITPQSKKKKITELRPTLLIQTVAMEVGGERGTRPDPLRASCN